MLKNNRNVFIGIIILIAILLISGVVLLFNKKTTNELPVTTEVAVPTLLPSDIGLTLEMGADGNRVIMMIENTDDIASVEYQLSYSSKGDIPRGAIGQVTVKTPGQAISQEIILGTCSDVCHYDEGVGDIKLIVKVTKTDGNVFQVEKTLQ
ncbi:MAG: hypothetical protein HYU48_02240 [Candidatus Levybacteria bacterium]|nr:hypothetical protein [Candidatus Levybacteria bacterium]